MNLFHLHINAVDVVYEVYSEWHTLVITVQVFTMSVHVRSATKQSDQTDLVEMKIHTPWAMDINTGLYYNE